MKKEILNYLFIIFGGILYALATVIFIFPHSLLLGGTSGISVILNEYISFSPGTILLVINFSLLIAAFVVLGRSMATKTLIGSVLTTLFVSIFEKIYNVNYTIIPNIYISATVGAVIIAIASGIMFYVDSSSGGTDIIALIVRKYSKINIGKALLITDVLIVIAGGAISGITMLLSSFLGLLIKTLGIDYVIEIIKNKIK